MCEKIDCRYNRWLNSGCHERACHYCLDMKHSRGCSAEGCTRFDFINTEDKKNQSKERIRGGMTVLRENIRQDVWHDYTTITT